MNHFELFGLPADVDVPIEILEQRYRSLSLESHPDRQSPTASEDVRLRAARRTAQLNDAYRTLRDRSRRLHYFLSLVGVDLDSMQASGQVQLAGDFLESVLALREELERLRSTKSIEALNRFVRETRSAVQAALESAEGAAREVRVGAPIAGKELSALAGAAARLRYYERLAEDASTAAEDL